MKISFIQTGGTIDKDYPKQVKGYAFEIDEAAFCRILEKIKPGFEYEFFSFLKKDSQEITETDREKLLEFINNLDNDKIIITHGSDTLVETADYLSSIEKKTVILTAAFLPERFKGSDADFNLGMAVGTVQAIQSGVYVVIQGQIFVAGTVRRNMENGTFERYSSA